MAFGKRLPNSGHEPIPAVQQTCVRCYGTGRVRERGDRIICKACAGTGRITVKAARAS
jgi:DnaJ-class molecular chaperone